MSRRLVIPVAALVVLTAVPARGQDPVAPPRAGARTLVGVVADTTGRLLDSVDVAIGSLRRRVSTNADGYFRFDDVKPGAYEVSARRFGFYPQTLTVFVGANGGTVPFSLLPRVANLPAVVSTAKRGGLSGIVGDTAYAIVPGAEITVLASDHRTVSDSSGEFYLDVKPGKYMVRVARAGFATQLISVTMPNGDGRRVVVWLTPASRGESARASHNAQELKDRLLRRSAAFSTLYTHEDILKMGHTEFSTVASAGASKFLDGSCNAIVDGGPYSVPLWTLKPGDVELVEVYADKPKRRTVTSISGGGRAVGFQAPAPSECGATVYVWLRK